MLILDVGSFRNSQGSVYTSYMTDSKLPSCARGEGKSGMFRLAARQSQKGDDAFPCENTSARLSWPDCMTGLGHSWLHSVPIVSVPIIPHQECEALARCGCRSYQLAFSSTHRCCAFRYPANGRCPWPATPCQLTVSLTAQIF